MSVLPERVVRLLEASGTLPSCLLVGLTRTRPAQLWSGVLLARTSRKLAQDFLKAKPQP